MAGREGLSVACYRQAGRRERKMPFTFSQTNEDNALETYDLSIAISPTDGVIDKVFDAGDVGAGLIAISNDGAKSAGVFLTADWGPSPPIAGDERLATLLANALTISVFVSSDDEGVTNTRVFDGRFMDLIDVSIHNFDADSVSEVKISVFGAAGKTGPTLLDKAILADFVFVAISTTA